MTTVTFDTHKAIEKLIKKGIEKKHAEAFIEAVQEGRTNDLNGLATKEQFVLLEKDIENITQHFATKADLITIKTELIKWQVSIAFIAVSCLGGFMWALFEFYIGVKFGK